MAVADGVRVGAAYVELRADDRGLRGEIQQDVAKASLGIAAKIGLEVDDARLRDARGRFVSAGRQMGDAAGAEGGRAFGDGVSKSSGDPVRKGVLGAFRGAIGSVISVGAEMGSALGEASSKASALFMRGPGLAFTIPAAVAMGSAVSAAISGAIMAGLSSAAIGGGIALAATDDRVKAAFKDLGTFAKKSLQDAASGFLAPSLDAIATIKSAFRDILPQIRSIFDASSQYVKPLVDGVVGLVRGVLPGLNTAIKNSAPIIQVISDYLPRIGTAVGDFFTKISQDSGNSAAALELIFKAVINIISGAGSAIRFLNAMFDEVIDVNLALAKLFEDIFGWVPGLGDKIRETKGHLEGFKKTTDNTANSSRGLTSAANATTSTFAAQALQIGQTNGQILNMDQRMSSLADKMAKAANNGERFKAMVDHVYASEISVNEATEAWEASIDDLTAATKQNGSTLDIHTSKGRSNRDAIQQAAQKMRELTQADLAAGKPMNEVIAKHAERTKKLEQEAAKAGLNKNETKKLIEAYGSVPKNISTALKQTGYSDIKDKLLELLAYTLSNKTGVSISSAYSALKKDEAMARRAGMAQGGPVRGPGTGTSDDIPVWLSDGEYVQPAATVSYYGQNFMEALRRRQIPRNDMAAGDTGWSHAHGYASGGLVGQNPVWPVTIPLKNWKMPPKPDIGGMGGSTGSGGWQWMMRVLRAAFPGLALISGYRPGAITATGNPSYHGKGRAVDLPPRMDVFNWIRSNYGKNTKELIFSPAGNRQVHNGRNYVYKGITKAMHYDHVHWAYDNGGPLPAGGMGINTSGKTEMVLNNAQGKALENSLASIGTTAGGDTFHVNLNVRMDEVGDVARLIEMIKAIPTAARRGGAGTLARV